MEGISTTVERNNNNKQKPDQLTTRTKKCPTRKPSTPLLKSAELKNQHSAGPKNQSPGEDGIVPKILNNQALIQTNYIYYLPLPQVPVFRKKMVELNHNTNQEPHQRCCWPSKLQFNFLGTQYHFNLWWGICSKNNLYFESGFLPIQSNFKAIGPYIFKIK